MSKPLSTKGMQEGGVPKTLSPGKHKVTINSIKLGQGYGEGSYNVYLNVEGPDLGPDFEGFFIDANAKSGPRYAGQVGRVRLSPFPYKDGVTKTGIVINRDQSILKGLKSLSKAVGLSDELDAIEADTIEEFVEKANDIFVKAKPFNIICGGRAWDNKGYTQYDLFVPNSKDGKYGFESADVDPKDSKLMIFDPSTHIQQPKAAETVQNFEPQPQADPNYDLSF
jgi:hypothetical protein